MTANSTTRHGPTVGGARTFVPLILFAVYLTAGSVLLSLTYISVRIIGPWTRVNATAAVGLVRLVGGEADIAGTRISFGRGSTDVMNGCSGMHAVQILSAAFLASPIGIVQRLCGIVFGAMALFGVNIVRIALVVLAGKVSWELMDLVHVYVLQTFVILCAFAIYLIWMKRFGS